MEINFIKTKEGYIASTPCLHIIKKGKTKKEAKNNLLKAIDWFLSGYSYLDSDK